MTSGISMSRRVRLTMLAVVAVLIVLGAAGCERRSPHPNVLFILVDTLRADSLGCYGKKRNSSPHVDKLAADSVRFTRAYAAAPWTLPSTASMLTGLYPTAHSATDGRSRLPASIMTLAEHLKAAGYSTAGVVSNGLLRESCGMRQGFDLWDETNALGHDYVSTEAVTRVTLDMFEKLKAAEEPFFLFVHYFDPHYDYKRHPEFGFAAPPVGRLKGHESYLQIRSLMETLTPEEVELLKDIYDEEIAFTDAGIGKVLQAFRDAGLYQNTIIVFTADHGEEFLERGWLGHTRTLYEEIVHVPLLIHLPGPAQATRSVEQPVSLVSLTPTILELAGVEVGTDRFQARSLVRLIEGGDADEQPVFSEVNYEPVVATNAMMRTRKRAVVSGTTKLIRNDETGQAEVYDLLADPQERRNEASARGDTLRMLLAALEVHSRTSHNRAPLPESVTLTKRQMEQLRALGYGDK